MHLSFSSHSFLHTYAGGNWNIFAWDATSGRFLFQLYSEDSSAQNSESAATEEKNSIDMVSPESFNSNSEVDANSVVAVTEGDAFENGHSGGTVQSTSRNIHTEPKQRIGNRVARHAGNLFVRTASSLYRGLQDKDDASGGATEVITIAASPSRLMWASMSDSKLRQISSQGQQLSTLELPASGWSLCVVDSCTLWVGCSDGTIATIAIDVHGATTYIKSSWRAHLGCIVSLALHEQHVYSLGAEGAVKRWHSATPQDHESVAIRRSLFAYSDLFTSHAHLRCTVGTWNVSDANPPKESLSKWLGPNICSSHIVALCVQEAETGAGIGWNAGNVL